MNWDSFDRPIVHHGKSYGAKEVEFNRILDLPAHAPWRLEVAVDARRAPVPVLTAKGWRHADAVKVSSDHESYRTYVSSSRGEFSVAKNVYVATLSGWFSCRSTCYLASGRPVVVQDTGFSRYLPTGSGLLAFGDLEEARAALNDAEGAYSHHAASARSMAETYFEGEHVLAEMLEACGVTQ